jgi:hypothetical protein
VKIKGGPWGTGLDTKDREFLKKYVFANGGSVVQYYPGDRTVIEFWIDQEEEKFSHDKLKQIARALLVLEA